MMSKTVTAASHMYFVKSCIILLHGPHIFMQPDGGVGMTPLTLYTGEARRGFSLNRRDIFPHFFFFKNIYYEAW